MSAWGAGRLFLGGVLDTDGERSGEQLIQDADDLTTHAVIVGMTGSGKTEAPRCPAADPRATLRKTTSSETDRGRGEDTSPLEAARRLSPRAAFP